MINYLKKLPHKASWNKHRNKLQSRELNKKIRKVSKDNLKKELENEKI